MRLLASILLLVVACVPPSPRGYQHADVPDVTIITADEAARYGLRAEPIELAFGPGRNGTDVVVELLRAAHLRGARYVGQIAIHLATTADGQNTDCVTAIGPKEELRQRSELVVTPGHTETRWVEKPVTTMETSWERQCHSESRPHTRMETTYDTEYDSFTHSSRSVPHTRTVTDWQFEQVCTTAPVTHWVTRTESQVENHYVPGRWETVSRTYSHWELAESTPSCALAPGATNHATGLVYLPPAPPPAPAATAPAVTPPAR